MKGLLRLFALVLLMLVVILTYARRENSGAWIAVFSNPDDAPGIFLMSGDGRSIRRILPHIIYGRKLDWSPDGRWLTYSEFIDNHNELRLMTIDGNEWRTLSTAPYYFGTVAWSPDSAWLAGVSSVSEERALYVFPINGESARLLGEQYVYPLWSPDGQWIYAAYATQDIIRIDRIHVQTGRIEQLINADTVNFQMDWSPDGRHMVLQVFRDGIYELLIINPDASSQNTIFRDRNLREIQYPRWSPDGEWIAFVAGAITTEYVFRIRPDGSDFQQLTSQPRNFAGLQWSPDGEWLLASTYEAGPYRAYRLRPDGSSLQSLTPSNGAALSAHYAPIYGKKWRPVWLIIAAAGMFFGSLVWRFRW